MNCQATINKITQYEIAMMDDGISVVDFSKYMNKIHMLREQLYYALIDSAHKKQESRKILIDDALCFILLEEKILSKNISGSQFANFLKELEETYLNLKEIDFENKISQTIMARLSNVVAILRINYEERIADVYNFLNKIREIKEKEI